MEIEFGSGRLAHAIDAICPHRDRPAQAHRDGTTANERRRRIGARVTFHGDSWGY
jgi:hypothetical protein